MWGLGCLVWESFNGPLRNRASLKDIENVKFSKSAYFNFNSYSYNNLVSFEFQIPKTLTALYCELVGASPATRPNPADIITKCRKPGGFFKNDLVDTLLFLEEIQIKDKTEKNRFFGSLTTQLDNFPDNVCRQKILPQLITAFEYGDAGSAVLAPMFKVKQILI